MAELVLKINPGSGYDDGDVLCAFNRRRIRCVHAGHICLPKFGSRLKDMDGNGIMPPGHLSQDWCEATHETRVERLSKFEAQLVRLSDGATIRFESDKPFEQFDGRTVHMQIPEFFARKRKAQQFPVFGVYGREVVYGGRLNFSDKALDSVWLKIEEKAGKRDTDEEHTLWPAGTQELKSHLFLPVAEFDDSESESLVASQYDTRSDPPQMVRKRTIRGEWQSKSVTDRLGVSPAAIADRSVTIDKRREVEPLTDWSFLVDKTASRIYQRKG